MQRGIETEDKARKKLERLQKEREEMGPVNLRAEVEADEVEKSGKKETADAMRDLANKIINRIPVQRQ